MKRFLLIYDTISFIRSLALQVGKKIVFTGVAVLMLTACTEVIQVDLNASDPQVVVEAHIDETGKALVRLRWSVNFEADNEFPAVEGADVRIEDEFGNNTQLAEVSPGKYSFSQLQAKQGQSYRLVIYAGEKLITAEDRMPKSVKMDSLTIRRFKFPFDNVGERFDSLQLLEAVVWYTDPVLEKNQYRILEYRNDTLKTISLTDDRFNNGKSIAYSIVSFREPLKPGDKLLIEFQSVSRPVYDYLFGFSGAGGGPFSSSPSNPVTNLRGTRLGYFSAHTVHRLGLMVPVVPMLP
jgi:hypothetical protein